MQPHPVSGDIYRHYKGKQYEIIAVGYHTETLEKVVIYKALYDSPEFGHNAVWVRPLSMFQETILIDGTLQLRFAPVREK